jgi:hypothetical protein
MTNKTVPAPDLGDVHHALVTLSSLLKGLHHIAGDVLHPSEGERSADLADAFLALVETCKKHSIAIADAVDRLSTSRAGG